MTKKLHWLLPIIFVLYISSSLVMLNKFPDTLPVMITNILSLSYVLFLPMVIVLSSVGLVEGELWVGPTMGGVILGTALYSLLLYMLGKRIQRYFHDDVAPPK